MTQAPRGVFGVIAGSGFDGSWFRHIDGTNKCYGSV